MSAATEVLVDYDRFLRAKATIAGQDGFEIDHVLAVAHGGTNAPSNLQVSHSRCNRSKGGRR